MTNITFIFETSPNTKPKEKKVRGHGILCPPRLKKWRGRVPRVPHQIAPMSTHIYIGIYNTILSSKTSFSHNFLKNGVTLKPS